MNAVQVMAAVTTDVRMRLGVTHVAATMVTHWNKMAAHVVIWMSARMDQMEGVSIGVLIFQAAGLAAAGMDTTWIVTLLHVKVWLLPGH